VALKTAYGRYITADEAGGLVARTEAMGILEMWEPVFTEEGDVLFRSNAKKYLTVLPGVKAHARSEVGRPPANFHGGEPGLTPKKLQAAGDGTRFHVFSSAERKANKRKAPGDTDESGSLPGVELEYNKKFMSWVSQPKLGQKAATSDSSVLYKARRVRQRPHSAASIHSIYMCIYITLQEGHLHEQMLDRRAQLKSDKYCK
jgi:protein FRG1